MYGVVGCKQVWHFGTIQTSSTWVSNTSPGNSEIPETSTETCPSSIPPPLFPGISSGVNLILTTYRTEHWTVWHVSPCNIPPSTKAERDESVSWESCCSRAYKLMKCAYVEGGSISLPSKGYMQRLVHSSHRVKNKVLIKHQCNIVVNYARLWVERPQVQDLSPVEPSRNGGVYWLIFAPVVLSLSPIYLTL